MAAALLLSACSAQDPVLRLEGPTMGTRWTVTLHPRPADADALQPAVESLLQAINQSMSTYIADSEISRFNALPPGETMTMSAAFAEVLEAALHIGELSAGAYDVSVGPLVDLWGFGAAQAPQHVPDEGHIEAVRASVGQHHLVWDPEAGSLYKRAPLRLDFSSIAKGYAVDQVASLLETRGIENYLVEIGGEIRVAGQSPRGDDWRLAVEQPELHARKPALGLSLQTAAVATSGDYRNFMLLDGQRYAHIIDPRTGWPVTHELVSVTVIHERCTLADGWATALSVLGREAALALAEEQALAVYLISRDGEQLRTDASSGFLPYLEANAEAPATNPAIHDVQPGLGE